jgi:hypothetical protein
LGCFDRYDERRCEVTDQLTRESDNNTQAELAAWELLKEAREERDKAQALARELRDALNTLGLVVGLTAFKHESQRAVLQEALDASRQALTNAREVLP